MQSPSVQTAQSVEQNYSGSGAIVFNRVHKVYHAQAGKVVALENVNFSIESGQFVSLVGPSGCGKSTLLKLLAGLIEPSEGTITIDDQPVLGPRRSVGMMFQTPVLFPWRTVLQNVLLPIEVFKLEREKYEQRALELIEMAGLSGFEKAYPKELSGGMQQRVALCRLLIFEPSVLLLDEPFGALDEFVREKLNLELLKFWDRHRRTVLFVTHNINEAVFLSDRVCVMGTKPGRVLDIVDIDLPRPRVTSIMQEQRFTDKVFEIRDKFEVL